MLGVARCTLLGVVGCTLLGVVGCTLLGVVGYTLLGVVGYTLLGVVGYTLLGARDTPWETSLRSCPSACLCMPPSQHLRLALFPAERRQSTFSAGRHGPSNFRVTPSHPNNPLKPLAPLLVPFKMIVPSRESAQVGVAAIVPKGSRAWKSRVGTYTTLSSASLPPSAFNVSLQSARKAAVASALLPPDAWLL
eukprot:363862-Chlamydomonas_euryale.AAC.14